MGLHGLLEGQLYLFIFTSVGVPSKLSSVNICNKIYETLSPHTLAMPSPFVLFGTGYGALFSRFLKNMQPLLTEFYGENVNNVTRTRNILIC
jgi:hypothetical protein